MKESIVEQKAFEFALCAVDVYKNLLKKNEWVFSRQFVRSATSIGANISEAQAGQSKRDFAAKMSIASKEAREVVYWIRVLKYAQFLDYDYTPLQAKAEELVRLLTAIVKTTQSNLKKK